MKIDFRKKQDIIFNNTHGVKIKGLYPLYKFKNGVKSEEIEGVTLKILAESELFFDLDYVFVKIRGKFIDDFEEFDLSKFYILDFKNLTGNVYSGKNGITLSLEATDIQILGVK